MLAPIRPRPTIPRRIRRLPKFKCRLHQRFGDDVQHYRESNFHVFAQVHAQCPSLAVGKNLEIAAGLRCFHNTERVLCPRYGQIVGVVTGNLQEDSLIRAALIRLSCRMQKARAETKTSGYLLGIPDSMTNLLQSSFVFPVHLNVAQHREVVAGLNAVEVGLYMSGKVPAVHGACIVWIGKQLDAGLLEDWSLWRQRSRLLVLIRELAGLNFAGFHVRLVEGIDGDNRTRHRGGDLPTEEFL